MKKAICVFIFTMILTVVFANATMACIGARAAGMGHSGVAGQTDATVVYWNPAMLPWAEPGFSAGIVRPNKYDFITISTENLGFLYVDETWDPYTHVSIGLEVTHDFAIGCSLGFGYSYPDAEWLPYISPAIAWRSGNITFGVLLQTMTNLRPAVCYQKNNLVLAAEYYDILDYYKARRLRLGCEYKWNILYIRFGSELANTELIKNFGLGLKTKIMSLDVSYDTLSKWTISFSI